MAGLRDLIRFERSQAVPLPSWLDRVVSFGIVTTNSKVARRQKIVNVASYAAAFNSTSRVVASAFYDFDGALLVQVISGAFAIWAVFIHRLHRFGENAAAFALLAWFLTSVSFASVITGLAGQVHVYFVLAGVTWLLFGLERWKLSIGATVVMCAVMLVVLNYAPQYGLSVEDTPKAANYFAVQSMLNAVAINSVVIVYALLLVRQAERDLERQTARAEALVDVVLPESIAGRLRDDPETHIADRIDNVSLLFADLAGFTPVAHAEPPEKVVAYLDEFVRTFDLMCQTYGVEKIKSIGDAYMAAGGLNGNSREAAAAIGELAIEMLKAQERRPPLGGRKLQLRPGIHCGTAIAGVIGDTRISYDLWGDAVNVASRMESFGVPGRIQVTDAYRKITEDVFEFEDRGATDIKGIGLARTHFLVRAR